MAASPALLHLSLAALLLPTKSDMAEAASCKMAPSGCCVDDDHSDSDGVSIMQLQRSLMSTDVKAASSLCEDGKLIPEFWLNGPPKCATTSLAQDLMRVGIPPACGTKECHYFEPYIPEQERAGVHLGYPRLGILSADDKGKWLGMLPDCPEGPTKRVIADFTPQMSPEVPPRLAAVVDEDLRPRLTFAMILREPQARAKSQWVNGQPRVLDNKGHFGRTGVCLRCSDSFEADLRENLKAIQIGKAGLAEAFFLAGSLYAKQLVPWLKLFSSQQFMFIPFRSYTENGGGGICKYLASRLQVDLACDLLTKASHHNPSSNTAAKRKTENISALLQAQWDKAMSDENEKLFQILADMHSNGATLWDYNASGSVDSVKDWLTSRW